MRKEQRIGFLIGLVLSVLLLGACASAETATPVPPTPTAAPLTATAVPVTSTPVPPTATPEPTITPGPTATPPPPSAEALLAAAFDASQQAGSYRFDGEMLIALSGPAVAAGMEIPARLAGDVQPPDRMQSTITETVSGSEVEYQVVVVGDTTYVKNAFTDRWQVQAQAETLFNPADLTGDASAVQGVELLGEATVEETPVYHLSGRASLPFTFGPPVGPREGEMLVHYWIGQEDARLLRSTVEGQLDFSAEVSATADISMTLRLFDYGVPLEIAAPEIATAAVISVPEVGPVAIEPTLLAPLGADTAEGHLQRGLASLADGRTGLALAHFDRALALQPDWPEALLYRGATQAIDGSVDAAMADLDRALEVEPDRADAYALRAWAYLRALQREELEADTAILQAREDITRALALDPALTAAASLKASADIWEALSRAESEPEQAQADLEAAIADLTKLAEDTDVAAGSLLSGLLTLFGMKAQDRDWLALLVDTASESLAQNPEAYLPYAVRGVAKLYLGSQPSPDFETLRQASDDLLYSIALAHRRMPDLGDPVGGPLQVAKVWEVEEATYLNGYLYGQIFFNQAPQSFPQFGVMLTSYWELLDLFAELVDDPIIFSVAFSPDGSQIATLSESGPSHLRLWDATTGEKLREVELGLDGMVIATTSGNLEYNPDGSRVVAAYTNPVARVIDTQTGEVTLELEHSQSIYSAAFSPDGKRIVTVDPEADVPVVWDAETGERVLTVTVGSAVSTVTFSPDGRQIVGGGEQVQVWDAETGELLSTLPGYEAGHRTAPAMSPDGTLLAMPGVPARVYDLIAETELYTITTGAATVVFSPDGSRIATAGFDVAGVWDAQTGDLVFLAGHPGGVDSVDFSPDGRLLVTGGSDGRFRVWDAETGAELWSGMAATLWWETSE